MSVSFIDRLFAFFDNVWSFILTLVRSLFTLFSFRRHSTDPLTLPSMVNRTPKDALAQAHSRLRPILLTPRAITRSPAYYVQRTQSARTRSATSTLLPGHSETGSVPQASDPQRTSPKLDPADPELGLSVTASSAADHAGSLGTSATSLRGLTPDTSLPTTHTPSLFVLPLTPPDRCYLAPMPSVTDCPYTEPWPTTVALDRGKHRLPGSPLKVSINTDLAFPESMVGPIGSPPPGRWSPEQIWTSTPCKSDHLVLDLALSPFDHHTRSVVGPSPALADISHALISRSRNSIQPYDDASNSSTSSDDNYSPAVGTRVQVPRYKNQPCPQFLYPGACAWRRHGVRVPGKSGRTTPMHAFSRSHEHMDLPVGQWYDTDAYVTSPTCALSPPRCEPPTEDEDEDEDEMPLVHLRERLARRSAAVGATIGLGVPLCAGMGVRRATAVSPRTRRMSEGCLLAISESTPTRIGVGARASRKVLSLALDGDGYSPKDWFEALSLRFSSEQRDPFVSAPRPLASVGA